MELLEDKKNKKIYGEDNRKYVMLNMGSYVGHKNREWYAKNPEAWILMAMKDGSLSIEALIDDQGEYSRLIITEDNLKRVLQISHDAVFSDELIVGENLNAMAYGDTYVALDGDIYSSNKVPLDDYLSSTPEFFHREERYEGKVPSSDKLLDFLAKNEELKELLAEEKRTV